MCCASLVDRCVLKIAPAITKNSFLFSEKNSEFQKCQKLTVCGQALVISPAIFVSGLNLGFEFERNESIPASTFLNLRTKHP